MPAPCANRGTRPHGRATCQGFWGLVIWSLGLWPCYENKNFGKHSTNRHSEPKFVVNKSFFLYQEKNPKHASFFLSTFPSSNVTFLCLVKPWQVPELPLFPQAGCLHPP